MNRRSWLSLAGATLVGCKGRQPAAGPATPAAKSATLINAGSFAVTVPADWSETAVVEKVEMLPVYTAEERQELPPEARSPHYQDSRKAGYWHRPQHWAIRLPAAYPAGISGWGPAGDDATAPQILIHKADEWETVFSLGVLPDPTNPHRLSQLRSDMDGILTKDDNWHVSPASIDASLNFECLKRRVDFDGGHGNRMLVQWTVEPTILMKGELHYLFLGMSDDDTCQIIATFPVSLPGLPDDNSAQEHLGHSTERYEEFTQNSDSYDRDARAWLEHHAAEITPNLETLDNILKSLVVRRWE